MIYDFAYNDFLAVASEEVTIGDTAYHAVINRTSSRYRDLNPLLGKNEVLIEVFVDKNDIKLGDIINTQFNEVLRVIEIRECIDRRITHCLCSMRTVEKLRNNEAMKQ